MLMGETLMETREVPLLGMHNIENTMAAALIAHLAGARNDQIRATVITFPGVEHRLEYVRELRGVRWYNDSKATNVDATLKALAAFEKLPAPVRVVHLVSLGFVALATIVLMASPAYHRIVERGRDTKRFHDFASRMVLLALALLGPGFCGDLYVVLFRAGYTHAALPVAASALIALYAAWFGAMFWLRRRRTGRLEARAA